MRNSNILKNKNIITLLLGNILYDSVLIVTYANVLISNIGKSAAIITMVLLVKKIIRTILDIPTGVFVDKFLTPKKSVLIAILLKIVFIYLFTFDNIYTLILSSIIEGISLSFFRGKMSVLQYETFENEGLIEEFYFLSSIYGLIVNISTIATATVSNILYKTWGIKYVINGSFITLSISLIATYLIPETRSKSEKKEKNTNVNTLNIKAIFNKKIPSFNVNKITDCIKKVFSFSTYTIMISNYKNTILSIDRYILSLNIVLGISCLGWQINSINQFFAINTLKSELLSAYVFQIGMISASIGCIITIFIKRRNATYLSLNIFISFLLSAILLIFLPEKCSFLGIFPYLLAANSTEVGVRKLLIESAKKDSRSTTMGISTTITSILSSLVIFIFQIMGNYMGYRMSYILIFIILSLLILLPLMIIRARDIKKI